MSAPWETLRKLPALSIPGVLEALEAARFDGGSPADGTVPLVTLMLRSGLELTGYVVRRDETGRLGAGGTLLLQRTDSAGRLDDDLTYIVTDSIDAVTVHGATRALLSLSGGMIEALPTGPAPTRLGLSRRAEALGLELTETAGAPIAVHIEWSHIAQDEASLRSVATALEESAATFRAIVEENGPDAFAQPVRGLRLEEGPVPGVFREDQTLSIQAIFSHGQAGRLTGQALKEAFEAVL